MMKIHNDQAMVHQQQVIANGGIPFAGPLPLSPFSLLFFSLLLSHTFIASHSSLLPPPDAVPPQCPRRSTGITP
eukprot:1878526-Rhodomonas_salina.6